MATFNFVDNGLYREDRIILGSATDPINTSDATPLVVYKIPTVINKGYLINVRFVGSVLSSATLKYAGSLFAGYGRDAGNIQKIDTDKIIPSITGFSGQTPAIRTFANVSTQTIDVEVTGRVATNLSWIVIIHIEYRI